MSTSDPDAKETVSAGPYYNQTPSKPVLGFHSIAYGPTIRLTTGSLLGAEGRVASTHEQIHHNLTESTTYGNLMQAASLLATTFPEHAWLGRNLRQLARRCRSIHEASATFQSIWLSADGDLTLLAGSRQYQNWYQDGAGAVPLPDHSRLKMLALNAMASVCMCPNVFDRFSSWNLLNENDWRLLPEEIPDHRFAAFQKMADNPFWNSITDQIHELLGSRAWALFVPPNPDPHLLTETFSPEYNTAVSAVSDVLNNRLTAVLQDLGYETQFAAEATFAVLRTHLATYIPWVEEVMAPSSPVVTAEQIVEISFAERILLSDRPRRAVIRSLQQQIDQAPGGLPLMRNDPATPYFFLATRTGRRLLRQYTFDEDDAQWLGDRLDQQVTYLLGFTGTSDAEWDLLVAEDPRCLRSLVEMVDGRVPIHFNRSLGATAKQLSPEATAAALWTADSCSAILDFPVLPAVQAWMKAGAPIRYAWGSLSYSGSPKIHVLACQLGVNSLFEETVIILSGDFQVRSLMEYFDQYGSEFDQTILSDKDSLIGAAANAIVSSEYVIDYRTSLRGEFQ
jgi:hypothetical protein